MLIRSLGSVLVLLVVVLSQGCADKAQSTKGYGEYGSAKMESFADLKNGELVYSRNCKVCHQDKGQGVSGYYPPIMGTESSKGEKDYLIKVLLYGLSGEVEIEGEKYNGVMSNYRNLKDKDIADVLNYIRSYSGGNLDMVTEEEVGASR